jgi:voltage-gated potassium channel
MGTTPAQPARSESRTQSAILQVQSSGRSFDRQLERLQQWIAKSPVRLALILLVVGRIIGGAVYSIAESDADWFDGAWWALVTQTTVGYGDFAPESFIGRATAEFVMWTAILAVAIITASFAGLIAEKRISRHEETPELDDDLDHLIGQIESLKSVVSDPRVEAALRQVHEERRNR